MAAILDRLIEQLKQQGRENAEKLARQILEKRGHLVKGTTFATPEGAKRGLMTPKERAIDRATKKSGRPPIDYIYDPKTNRTKLAPWAERKR